MLHHLRTSLRAINSPTSPIAGGMGVLHMHTQNHVSAMGGIKKHTPLLMMILRDFEFVYIMLDKKNSAEAVSPWLIITTILPVKLFFLLISIITIINIM